MTYTKYEGRYTSSAVRPGERYDYAVWVPDVPAGTVCGLLVTHDGLNEAHANAIARLADTGEAPPCVVIGLVAGCQVATVPGGYDRGERFNEYDVFSSLYVDFLVDEFIPWAREKYALTFSDEPDMHMITGGSSGGISAWNGVWFRNDFFRRCYLSSPTFSAMARGNMAPVFMRIFETKPIRVYIDYSENEPDDYFGSSYCAALEGQLALEFAGYDYKSAYYPGEGHCSRNGDEETAVEIDRFLWKNWQTEPVRPLRLSKRADAVIYADQPWEKTDAAMPAKPAALAPQGTYTVRGNTIVLCADAQETVVAEDFEELTGIAVSCDLWRLYAADARRGCLYVFMIAQDGTLFGRRPLCSLALPTDFGRPGAFDLCADSADRIYAATELGIQCVRAFGLIDVILPLPGNVIPTEVALDGDMLYARSGEQVYRRRIKLCAKTDPLEQTEPKFVGYYD